VHRAQSQKPRRTHPDDLEDIALMRFDGLAHQGMVPREESRHRLGMLLR